jgi:TetR/AcrR family transcriptional repressor of mexJK operon
MKAKRAVPDPEPADVDERFNRIAAASLEVFSEYSFQDATTDEIARRARVSKRDIYSRFPSKHDILLAAIRIVLQADEDSLTEIVSFTRESTSLRERLEVIALALINQVLSRVTGSLTRIILSESFNQPQIGSLYFEKWYASRTELISAVLAHHTADPRERSARRSDTSQAAKHFVALVIHLPQMMASVGMRDSWNSKLVQTHVKSAVKCFLDAYPMLPNH